MKKNAASLPETLKDSINSLSYFRKKCLMVGGLVGMSGIIALFGIQFFYFLLSISAGGAWYLYPEEVEAFIENQQLLLMGGMGGLVLGGGAFGFIVGASFGFLAQVKINKFLGMTQSVVDTINPVAKPFNVTYQRAKSTYSTLKTLIDWGLAEEDEVTFEENTMKEEIELAAIEKETIAAAAQSSLLNTSTPAFQPLAAAMVKRQEPLFFPPSSSSQDRPESLHHPLATHKDAKLSEPFGLFNPGKASVQRESNIRTAFSTPLAPPLLETPVALPTSLMKESKFFSVADKPASLRFQVLSNEPSYPLASPYPPCSAPDAARAIKAPTLPRSSQVPPPTISNQPKRTNFARVADSYFDAMNGLSPDQAPPDCWVTKDMGEVLQDVGNYCYQGYSNMCQSLKSWWRPAESPVQLPAAAPIPVTRAYR